MAMESGDRAGSMSAHGSRRARWGRAERRATEERHSGEQTAGQCEKKSRQVYQHGGVEGRRSRTSSAKEEGERAEAGGGIRRTRGREPMRAVDGTAREKSEVATAKWQQEGGGKMADLKKPLLLVTTPAASFWSLSFRFSSPACARRQRETSGQSAGSRPRWQAFSCLPSSGPGQLRRGWGRCSLRDGVGGPHLALCPALVGLDLHRLPDLGVLVLPAAGGHRRRLADALRRPLDLPQPDRTGHLGAPAHGGGGSGGGRCGGWGAGWRRVLSRPRRRAGPCGGSAAAAS